MSSVSLNQSEKLLVGVLGFENVASPYVDDLLEKEEIAAQFLEAICIQEHKRVEAWLSRKYGNRSKEWLYWVSAGSNPLDVKLRTGNGLLIPLVVTSDGVTYEEAIRIIIRGCGFGPLANYLGEKLAGLANAPLRQGATRIVAPDCLVIDNKNFSKSRVIYNRNYSGIIDSGILCYRHNDRYVLQPLASYQEFDHNILIYFLSLGVPDAKFRMLNADMMNSHKNSNVFVFENPMIANDFSLLIKDSSLVSSNECIATCVYGGLKCFDDVDLSSLHRQNVYFILSPSRDSYTEVIECVDKCRSVGVRSVKIFIDPILEFKRADVGKNYNSVSCPLDRYILNNAFCYMQSDLLPMIQRFLDLSITPEVYCSWAQEHMLIDNGSVSLSDDFSSIVTNGYDMVQRPLLDKDCKNVSLHDLLSPDKVSMCVGYSHEGKTVLTMSLITSYVSGKDMFIFNNKQKGKVLLVDSESGKDFIHEVFLQITTAYDVEESDLSSFHYISLLDMPREKARDFDLLSDGTQLKLKEFVQRNGIGLIVLDNLQSMFENATSSSKTLHLIVKFIELMQSIRVAVLLVHHTLYSNKRKPQGLTQLVNRMRNIILLEGYETLNSELMKLGEDDVGDSFVQKFIDHAGIIVRLVFTKCNSYPHLRNKSFLYHLHYTDIRTQVPKKWISENDDCDLYDDNCDLIHGSLAQCSCCDSDSYVDDIHDIKLVDDFQKYCDLVIRYAHDHPDFNGMQIQSEFRLSKKEAKKVLDHLVDSGALNRTGSTSNRRYRIRFQGDKA